MAVLFKTWLECDLGRFLLGCFRVSLSRGLTRLMGLENGESARSGDQFRRVPRNNPFLIRGYHKDVDFAVRRRNF